MLKAYRHDNGRLSLMGPDEDLTQAVWIDLIAPRADQVAAVNALGMEVPSLADMEEIEVSNRLYRENGTDYMTVVLSGHSSTNQPISGPVTFILQSGRLVTVRHHRSRPFETYPERADKVGPGCADPDRLLLSLFEEIIGRLADLLESVGRGLDEVSRNTFASETPKSETLQRALQKLGREGDLIGIVRLALLTMERALSFFGLGLDGRGATALRPLVKSLFRDIQALEVHCDFLSQRVGLASDATLGMINLAQNSTVRIVSVVAVLFSPPTLIASIYGMNFNYMPELSHSWGYPAALVAMVASSVGAWAFFRWRNWL